MKKRTMFKGVKAKSLKQPLAWIAVAAVIFGAGYWTGSHRALDRYHKLYPERTYDDSYAAAPAAPRSASPRPAPHAAVRVTPVTPAAPSVPATPRAERPAVKRVGPAKLAIVLDDWGNDKRLLRDLLAIKRPMTVAILPHLEHSTAIAREARAAGLGTMLHLPMQAKSKGAPQEPDTILTTSTDAEIRRTIDRALADVPGVEGVNNHQGSAATSDERVMRSVLKHLKEKKLFFIDSFVIASTVAADVAAEMGVPHDKRDVFIDNVNEVEAVKTQLRKAVEEALRSGEAVAIGHDRRVTLRAIAELVDEIEAQGVRLVYARDLVRAS